MDIEQRIKADAAKSREKLAKIKKWATRMDKLKKRAKEPLKECDFCEFYEINVFRFNRYKNMKEKSLPSDEFLKSVEDAFEIEGV